MSGQNLLVVRSGGRAFAIRYADIVEIGDRAAWQQVPARIDALRGVTQVRGRLLPLVHLGALIEGHAPPAEAAPLMVVAESQGWWVALEVDEVDSAEVEDFLGEEQDGGLSGMSAGAIRREGRWIPVLNLEALARRWQEPATKA